MDALTVKIQWWPVASLRDRGQTAHHEMEWFFATTEGFLSPTSIMVGKTTHSRRTDLEDFLPARGKLANTASQL
jgi:hypothetical protein